MNTTAQARRDRVAARRAERVWVDGELIHPQAEHGKAASYTNLGCRCTHCRDANTAAAHRMKTKRMSTGRVHGSRFVVPAAPHGRPGTKGNWGCECWPCVYAAASRTNRHPESKASTR